MTHRMRQWLRRRVLLGLALAALAAPAAHAQVMATDGGSSPNVIPYMSHGMLSSSPPTLAELLFDGEAAIAALDAEPAVLALDRKADVFEAPPKVESGREIGWREIGAGMGLGGIVAALCAAAFLAGRSSGSRLAHA